MKITNDGSGPKWGGIPTEIVEMYPNEYLEDAEGRTVAIENMSYLNPQQSSNQFDELTKKGFSLNLVTGTYYRCNNPTPSNNG